MRQASTVNQLKKRLLSQKECPSPILVICPNEIRKERFLLDLLDAYLGKDRDIAKPPLRRLDLADLTKDSLRRLENEVMALSLFEPVRYFHLRNADDLPSGLLKGFTELVSNVPGHSKLVLSATKLAASSPIYKRCKEADAVIELPKLKEGEILKWIEKELADQGVRKFPAGLPEALSQRAEGDVDRLVPLVEWVALLSDGEELTAESLGPLLSRKDEYGEFALLDAIAERDRTKSLIILENLLQNGANPFVLLSMVARTFSQYAKIRDQIAAGKHQIEIMEAIGVDPKRSWAFEKKQLPAARRRTPDELMTALIHIFRADTKLKNKSLGSESIFSELVDRLAS